MPGLRLTSELCAELDAILGMLRRSGSPFLALCAARFQAGIERRRVGERAALPLQLGLWHGVDALVTAAEQAPESRANAGG
ncbi:MAG: hypothetical protein WCC48_07805 [Anaeromyxobacteraceae bacterium]